MMSTLILALLGYVCMTRATPSYPEIDSLWNFADPASTRERFLGVLEAPEPPSDAYRLELMTQVARCEGLLSEFERAHRTLDGVASAMGQVDSQRVRLRYLLERGRVFNSSSRPDQARPLFKEAASVKPEGDLKPLVIDAMHMMAIVSQDPAEQIAWGRRGIELARADPPVLRWLIPLLNNLGETHRSQHDYAEALACFEALIATQRQLGRPVGPYARVDEAKMLRLLGRADEAFACITALRDELAASGQQDGFVEEEFAEGLLVRGDPDAPEAFSRAWTMLQSETWLEEHEPQRWARLRELARAGR